MDIANRQNIHMNLRHHHAKVQDKYQNPRLHYFASGLVFYNLAISFITVKCL